MNLLMVLLVAIVITFVVLFVVYFDKYRSCKSAQTPDPNNATPATSG